MPICICGIIYLDLIDSNMFLGLSQAEMNLIITYVGLGIFIIGFTTFMMWQEKKLKDLEKKAKK